MTTWTGSIALTIFDRMGELKREKNLLLILGLCSLGLISITDKLFFDIFNRVSPLLAIIADLRLTSLLLITLIWIWIGKKNQTDRSDVAFHPRQLILPIIWTIFTAYFVLVKQVWVPKLVNWIDFTAFLLTGLLAEELLFRGTIFNLCGKVFGFRKIAKFSAPVWISAILFSLQHLGYHGFQINSASVSQLSYTLLMGLVFGHFRESTGCLWPVITLHMITNSFTVIRNLN